MCYKFKILMQLLFIEIDENRIRVKFINYYQKIIFLVNNIELYKLRTIFVSIY